MEGSDPCAIRILVYLERYQKLVYLNEDFATFDATVHAAFVDAFVIGDKAYGYHLSLCAACRTFHDSDVRDIVVFDDP